jgi:hypothetical protein
VFPAIVRRGTRRGRRSAGGAHALKATLATQQALLVVVLSVICSPAS